MPGPVVVGCWIWVTRSLDLDGVLRGDLAGLDVGERLVRGVRRGLRHDLVELAESDGVVRDREEVVSGLEGAEADRADRLEDGDVHLLERARDNGARSDIGLVGVDPDGVDAGRLGSLDVAEAATAGHLEEDVAALADVALAHLDALLLVDEVLAVAVQDLGRRADGLDRVLVARDVPV